MSSTRALLRTLRDWPARLWRQSALRQALLLTALFLAVMGGAAVFAVFDLRDAMDRRLDVDLEARFEAVRAGLADGSVDAASLAWEDWVAIGIERVLYLLPGERRSAFWGRRGTFYEQSPERRDDDGVWLYFAGPAGDGWLVVGRDASVLSVFDEVLIDTFAGLGWATVCIALAAGLVTGLRAQRRLGAVRTVLARAADGDLTARVAPKEGGDDLDALGRQVDEALGRISAAMEQARGFSAAIAHDLKTPITRLRLRLEGALTGGATEDEIGAALEEADRAVAIFDAFLRLSKLESGALERAFEPVDLEALVRDLGETYGPVIEDSGRRLDVSLTPATIKGDRVLLGQLLTNLIQNALRHTPPGTALTLFARPGAMGLDDTGPGIPEAERAKVTRPLYRLDRSRGSEGAGLGLALARGIAVRHGAELAVTGREDGAAGLRVAMVWEPGMSLTKM